MAFYFKELKIKNYVNFRWALIVIKGIGFEKVSYLSDLLGLNVKISLNSINFYVFEAISFLIKYFYKTDVVLKTIIKNRRKLLYTMNLIKAIRYFRKVPVRGQRTHSNGKCTKYRKLDEEDEEILQK